MATTEVPKQLNGRVNGFAHPPPMKRPRLELVEKEKALALRKKYVAYVRTNVTYQMLYRCEYAGMI